MAVRLDNQVREIVEIPVDLLPHLIEHSVHAYNKQMKGLAKGIAEIPTLNDTELAAVLDTGMVDYYDR